MEIGNPRWKEFQSSDFAAEPSFIQWVKEGDPEIDRCWAKWLAANPDMTGKVEVARSLVLAMLFRFEVSADDVEKEWDKLKCKTTGTK